MYVGELKMVYLKSINSNKRFFSGVGYLREWGGYI